MSKNHFSGLKDWFNTPQDFIRKTFRISSIIFMLSYVSFSLTAQTRTVSEYLYPDQKLFSTYNVTGNTDLAYQEIADPSQSHNGLLWQFSIGTLAGNKKKEDMNGVPGIMMMASYRFNKRISCGIGLGIEVMEYSSAPVYADFKLHLPVNRSYSPFLYANAGKSMPLSKPPESFGVLYNYTGGFMSGAGAGVLLPGGEDFGWYFQAGYRYNELRTEVSHGWVNWQSVIIHYYHRLELRLGVFFN